MKRRQEIEVSNKLIKSLIERGFLVHKYYARTTKSVYLKLDYGACCGIRISDHRGKKKYKYKFNLIKQYEGSKTVLDKGFIRLFYNYNNTEELITDSKKEWIKSKLKDGHVFRKLNARGKIFIEYEPIETAWVPISGKNYEYIYCLWVAGSFKGKGIGKELIEYAINDSKEKGKSGICTLVSKKKKPFIGEKKFFEYYGFKVVDTIGDYELLALQFDDSETPRFNDNARTMKIDNQDFTIYYSNECPYVEYEVNELTEYAKENNIKINFIKIDSLEKAKNAPCIFNNWANFYKGKFISNTILNANSFKKLID